VWWVGGLGGVGFRGHVSLNNMNDTLCALNSNVRYDLKPVLLDFFGDDNDDNSIIQPDQSNHIYHDIQSFCKSFSNNGGICLSLNVCSLMSKHSELSLFIQKLLNFNINIIAIALQEVWEISQPDLVYIPGFKLHLNTRKNNRGGGTAFYVKNDIPCKILNNLSYNYEKVFECLTIEIMLNKRKTVLSNIYRSPNPHNDMSKTEYTELFVSYLDTHLHNLAVISDNVITFLDANINLLNFCNDQSVALYLVTIFSNGFNQHVGKATRIVNDSYSLIDHILSKSSLKSLVSGTIISDISDHLPNFINVPNYKRKACKNEYTNMRNFSYVNMNGFRENLRNCNWNNVIHNNDVNDSYEIFWNDFSALFDLHFPIKKVKFNKNVHKKNDFMTLGLLTSRNTKNELYKKTLLNPELFLSHYKKFRNIYNSLIRQSKQIAIDEKFKKFKKNPKKLGIC